MVTGGGVGKGVAAGVGVGFARVVWGLAEGLRCATSGPANAVATSASANE
jgi:hypothetical protein